MKSVNPTPSAASSGASLTAKTFPAVKAAGKPVTSIIGEECSVIGNVSSKGEVQFDGEIEGDIGCASLVIGDKACVSGGVVAQDLVVRGRVVGSIRGTRVTLQSGSHVEADIYYQSLAIEQGAFFEGTAQPSEDPNSAFAKSEAPAKERASVTGPPKSGKLQERSRISGDIFPRSIGVEHGAVFEGSSKPIPSSAREIE